MQDLRNILVPTDFSPNATNALIYGINLAEQIDAHLYIAHVQDDNKDPLATEVIEDRFEQIKHDFLFRRTLRTSLILRHGQTAAELESIIKDKGIDLMIMGMLGGSRRHEANFGSLTTYFINDPKCALISIPGDCRILTIKQIALASDYTMVPVESEIYTLSYIAGSFSSKFHVFTVQKSKSEPEGKLHIEQNFKNLFRYNLSSFHAIDAPSVISATREFIEKNNIDLLAVFHMINPQKDPVKRSVSKQLAFVLRIPLLVVPIQCKF
ncbi:MAG: universal stress protein [Bacteroidota bacterium]